MFPWQVYTLYPQQCSIHAHINETEEGKTNEVTDAITHFI